MLLLGSIISNVVLIWCWSSLLPGAEDMLGDDYSVGAESRNISMYLKYDPYWLAVSFERNVAVTWIPKVMCTSIRDAMNTIECGPRGVAEPCAMGYHNRTLLTDFLGAAATRNMTHVVWFRDPFDRALSLYRNSVANAYISLPGCRDSRQCTFDEWVKKLDKFLPTWMNRIKGSPPSGLKRISVLQHFLPQITIAQTDAVHYDHELLMSSQADQHFFWRSLLKMEGRVWLNNSTNKVHDEAPPALPLRRRRANIQRELDAFVRNNDTLHTLAKLYQGDLDKWHQLLKTRGDEKGAKDVDYSVADYYEDTLRVRSQRSL